MKETKHTDSLFGSSEFIDNEEVSSCLQQGKVEKITPLPAEGSTCIPYLVQINGREFFMKCIKPELRDNAIYAKLFRKEFELGQRLNSPYIVKYYELTEHGDDLYIIRENVCGASIAQKLEVSPEWFIRRKNLDRMMNQLLEGISHMHDQHIVHGDLNPQNIMLSRINNDVKIIDFGFAFSDDYTTTAGRTLQFAAPEQVCGNTKTINNTTDLYSIGKLLEYIQQKTQTKLPAVYQKIIQKCLKAEQSDRYQNAREIMDIINRKRKMMRETGISAGGLLLMLFSLYLFSQTYVGNELIKETQWALKDVDYDHKTLSTYYKLNPDSATCTVVGGLRINSVIIDPIIHLGNKKKCRTTRIGNLAFYKATHLEACYIPNGIQYIGEKAFAKTSITAINLPESVTEIGEEAFCDIKGLKCVHFPVGLSKLPKGLLHHCTDLKEFNCHPTFENSHLTCLPFVQVWNRWSCPTACDA